jgi:arylsulfatase A-like enzyme
MRKNFLTKSAVLAVCMFVIQGASLLLLPSHALAAQPNIILINVDNMGWGDLCKNVEGSAIKPEWCGASSGTPNLDTLATGGVRLTNFYTPVPICTPSRAALMTGLDPRRYGIIATPGVGGPNELPGSAWTLAEELKGLGYNTAIIGKWQLGFQADNHSWKQGFEYNYVLPVGIHYGSSGFCLGENYNDGTPYWQHINGTLPSEFGGRQYSGQTCAETKNGTNAAGIKTEEKDWADTTNPDPEFSNGKSLIEILTNKAIQYIDTQVHFDSDAVSTTTNTVRSMDNPFFIYLAYPAPHSTLRVHLPTQPDNLQEDDKTKCQSPEGKCKNTCNNTNGSCKNECKKADGTCATIYTQDCVHQCELDFFYKDVIKELDSQVAQVLTKLGNTIDSRTITEDPETRKFLKDTTIVIFISDNGPFIGQSGDYLPLRAGRTGGMRGGQKHNFEGGVRVPFIASWPGNWVGTTSADISKKRMEYPADMMDIFTTLVSVAGGIDQYTDQTSYVGTDGDKCNSPLTVTNDKGGKIALDGKDITAILKGNGTCLQNQKKDIHTNWILTSASCIAWKNPTTLETWTLGNIAPDWLGTWGWWPHERGFCDVSLPDDTEYGTQYPYAIRSNNPNTVGSFVLGDYKLYMSGSHRPFELYNINPLANPYEEINSKGGNLCVVGTTNYCAYYCSLVKTSTTKTLTCPPAELTPGWDKGEIVQKLGQRAIDYNYKVILNQ